MVFAHPAGVIADIALFFEVSVDRGVVHRMSSEDPRRLAKSVLAAVPALQVALHCARLIADSLDSGFQLFLRHTEFFDQSCNS